MCKQTRRAWMGTPAEIPPPKDWGYDTKPRHTQLGQAHVMQVLMPKITEKFALVFMKQENRIQIINKPAVENTSSQVFCNSKLPKNRFSQFIL